VTASCFYEGTVRHRRSSPHREFRHRLALAYVDLDEVPRLLGGRLVRRRPGVLRFRRGDYLGQPDVPLDACVRGRVRAHTGTEPDGPIRVLTHLRSFGHCFNPVTFYYCMSHDGESVRAIVAEVTNTPWGERYSYVITGGPGPIARANVAKALYVSPFLGMTHEYRIAATAPGDTLSVHIESHDGGLPVFDATLALRRREWTRATAARITARYPCATARVLTLIYGHGLALRLARIPVHRHPGTCHR
jgi:DUF1365 family protein